MKKTEAIEHCKEMGSDGKKSYECQSHSLLNRFGRYVYPEEPEVGQINEDTVRSKAEKILNWALQNGVEHYTFLSFPHTSGIFEKQDSFLDVNYVYENGLKSVVKMSLTPQLLLKSETDGSSFPNGGLRETNFARAYTVWDQKSELFIRKRNKVLYIPSLLVTHSGSALDDKTLFRNSEYLFEASCKKLLQLTGVTCKSVMFFLGLEQEFFVIPLKDYEKRIDIRQTGRSLIGDVNPRNQQFGEHYMSKLPYKMEQILKEVQDQLVEIGIPFKTRHNEVSLNQFQFSAIYEDAGKSIDHNMITMDILKETFHKHGYAVLLHEKPFQQINGSGKHANWSLNYATPNGKIINLFALPSSNPADLQRFQLFMLLNLMALLKNDKLYLSAIAVPGNQLRLGGHEAPPRILSVFLGDTTAALVDGLSIPKRKDLKEQLQFLEHSVQQEDTDRNRSSPYAYTGNKFEFRAVGSTQNVNFPMAVIAATLKQEIDIAIERIQKGETIDGIIKDLREKTQSIRFNGNGYSKQWPQEAKKRRLYVNEKFIENYTNFREAGKIFVEIGACKIEQIQSKAKVLESTYNKTVQNQYNTLVLLAEKNIIPRCYKYLETINNSLGKESLKRYADKFTVAFDKMLLSIEGIEKKKSQMKDQIQEWSKLRKELNECCELITKTIKYLEKDQRFPDLEDILLL